jgi:hypothetical protein
MKTVYAFLALLVVTTGCSKGFSYNPYTNETFQPRRSVHEVQVLFDNPKQAYKTMGFVDYDFYKPGWASPTISEAMPSLKEKVHKYGGDAIIVRNTTAGLGMERNLRIIGDVIRFEP